MRIAVTATQPDAEAPVGSRLGKAPYLIVYDTRGGTCEALDSRPPAESPCDDSAALADLLARHRVDVVLTGRYGPTVYLALSSASIRVRDGATGTVMEAIRQYLGASHEASGTRPH